MVSFILQYVQRFWSWVGLGSFFGVVGGVFLVGWGVFGCRGVGVGGGLWVCEAQKWLFLGFLVLGGVFI